jgi:hypothetical protein
MTALEQCLRETALKHGCMENLFARMREKEIQMALLTKPNELVMKETYAGLIYGQPGVGKSTLALSIVNPVCIDVDRGMYRVEKRYQVPSLQVESYQQVLDLLNSNELDGFDTIVIDTLGKLVGSMEEYVAPKKSQITARQRTAYPAGLGSAKNRVPRLDKADNRKKQIHINFYVLIFIFWGRERGAKRGS